jgi:hypothetical protein
VTLAHPARNPCTGPQQPRGSEPVPLPPERPEDATSVYGGRSDDPPSRPSNGYYGQSETPAYLACYPRRLLPIQPILEFTGPSGRNFGPIEPSLTSSWTEYGPIISPRGWSLQDPSQPDTRGGFLQDPSRPDIDTLQPDTRGGSLQDPSQPDTRGGVVQDPSQPDTSLIGSTPTTGTLGVGLGGRGGAEPPTDYQGFSPSSPMVTQPYGSAPSQEAWYGAANAGLFRGGADPFINAAQP